MDKHDEKVFADIQQYGWHVVQILEDEVRPAFAFSIGLFQTFQHPEIIIFGLPLEMARQVLNNIGQEIEQGKQYWPAAAHDDILEGYKCSFLAVDRKWYAEYLGYAIWFYKGEPFPVMQCVWPDKQHRYPWDSDFNEQLRERQPLLTP